MRELIGLAVAAVGRQAPAVFFITGEKGEGKTTLLVEIVKHLRAHGIQVGGIAACAVSEAGLRVGFDVMNVASGERRPLARLKTGEGRNLTSGKYEFFQDGLRMGRKALSSARRAGSQVVVVDEVGPLELGGHGWAANLDELLAQPVIQIWVVRRGLLEQVKAHWGLSPAGVFRVARTSPEEVFSAIEAVLFETEEPEVTASVTTAAAGPGLKSSGWQLKST